MPFEKNNDEEKKPREKHPLIINGKNLDDLANQIRKVTPCNRKKIIEIGMTDFFDRFTDSEICIMASGDTFEDKMLKAGFEIEKEEEDIVIP